MTMKNYIFWLVVCLAGTKMAEHLSQFSTLTLSNSEKWACVFELERIFTFAVISFWRMWFEIYRSISKLWSSISWNEKTRLNSFWQSYFFAHNNIFVINSHSSLTLNGLNQWICIGKDTGQEDFSMRLQILAVLRLKFTVNLIETGVASLMSFFYMNFYQLSVPVYWKRKYWWNNVFFGKRRRDAKPDVTRKLNQSLNFAFNHWISMDGKQVL